MAFQGTKLNNLIDPEVIGQFLDVKLINAIKFIKNMVLTQLTRKAAPVHVHLVSVI